MALLSPSVFSKNLATSWGPLPGINPVSTKNCMPCTENKSTAITANADGIAHLLRLLIKPLNSLHQGRLLLFRALESARIVGDIWCRASHNVVERKSIV